MAKTVARIFRRLVRSNLLNDLLREFKSALRDIKSLLTPPRYLLTTLKFLLIILRTFRCFILPVFSPMGFQFLVQFLFFVGNNFFIQPLNCSFEKVVGFVDQFDKDFIGELFSLNFSYF